MLGPDRITHLVSYKPSKHGKCDFGCGTCRLVWVSLCYRILKAYRRNWIFFKSHIRDDGCNTHAHLLDFSSVGLDKFARKSPCTFHRCGGLCCSLKRWHHSSITQNRIPSWLHSQIRTVRNFDRSIDFRISNRWHANYL